MVCDPEFDCRGVGEGTDASCGKLYSGILSFVKLIDVRFGKDRSGNLGVELSWGIEC